MKGIKREFSVARNPQQNGVAERKNKTLIEAVRTMLADSKLPTTFWAEAVNTACRNLALSFMRSFGCTVTILNTINHLGKFDGKADEGFFVGYSTNSKAFKVFNNALTNSMNYKPVVAGNQSNGNVGTKAYDDASKARMETVPRKDYILLPMWHADPLFSQNSKESPNVGFKPLGEEEKMDTEDPGNENEDSRKDSEVPSIEEPRKDQRVNQELDASINSTNNINTASDGNNTNNVNAVSSTVNAAVTEVNVVDPKTSIELPNDPNMPELEDIVYSDDDEDVGAEADMNNLDAFMPVSPIPTTRIHKDHLVEQIIGDLNSAPQTRRMTKNLEEHEVWTLVNLPNGKRAIGTKRVYMNKKDERGIVKKNKERLVAQGYTQEEGIDYDEIEEEVYVFQPPGFEDPDFPNRVYKVEKGTLWTALSLKAWYETLSTYLLDNGFQRGKINKTLFIKREKCKKQTVVANSTTEAEYVAASSCSLWIQNQLLDYGYSKIRKANSNDKIHPDKNVANLHYKKHFDVATVKVKTVNGEVQLQALVDGKKIILTEGTIRRDLQLEDAKGIDYLSNATIFKQLTLMGTFHDPTLTQHTQPHHSQSKETSNIGSPRRKDNRIPQSSVPSDNLADEAVNEENVSKHSNDPLLNGEDRLKLEELMALCTNLQNRILDLEYTKTTQALDIDSLKRRVKKLEKIQKSKTHGLKRLYKVGLSVRVVSSKDEGLGEEDASKQGRKIHDINADEDITLKNVHDAEMFDVNDLDGDEVDVEREVADKDVNLSVDKVTLAQALTALKIVSLRPRAKGIVFHEQEKAPTLIVSSQNPSQIKVQDNGKGKMNEPEPVKKLSKNDQLRLNEELAFRLQAEEEEERLAREKAQKLKKPIQLGMIFRLKLKLIISWLKDCMIKQYTDEEKAKFFCDFLDQRIKFFAAKRAEAKRNKPPTQAQQIKLVGQEIGLRKAMYLNEVFGSILLVIDELLLVVEVKTAKVRVTAAKYKLVLINTEEASVAPGGGDEDKEMPHAVPPPRTQGPVCLTRYIQSYRLSTKDAPNRGPMVPALPQPRNSQTHDPSIFKVRDKVLLFNSRFKMHPRKLKSKWYGLNVVKTVYPYGTMEITDKNKISFKANGQRLKKYYDEHVDTDDKEVAKFEGNTTFKS
ncbi:putative ribonuclease H-like domain-containing protein [Tanacetum coccineum]